MDAFFPMPSNQTEAETLVYLRESLPNSQSETPLRPSDVVAYMNCPSTSGPYAGGLPENSQSQASCINLHSDSNICHQEFLLNFEGSGAEQSHLSTWGAASGVLQGLSLTLGPHTPPVMQFPGVRYRKDNPNVASVLGLGALVRDEDGGKSTPIEAEDDVQNKQFSSVANTGSDVVPIYEMMNIASAVSSSKYLKAAQQLLDEVVNVKRDIKDRNYKKELRTTAKEGDGEPETASSDPSAMASSFSPKAGGSSTIQLSGSEKQELHSRLTQLLVLLDDVDRRYRQYSHQMQMIVSSFDSTAGSGAAKPYTSLALQTISRHFRSLRDAINRQIHVARRSLGEEDASSTEKVIGISRLRYVDRNMRQQRVLQQLGLMHQQAWRPQRGLPETSVSILRAWLFEHFLNPYPKDSDKIMLARQTGLTRCQVSNWFINARVRLWKPMIEEMYKEELGDVDIDSNSSSEASQTPGKSATNSTADKFENPSNHTTSTSLQPESTVASIGTSTNPLPESNSGDNGGLTSLVEFQIPKRCRNINEISLTLGLQQGELRPTSILDGTGHGFLHLRDNNVVNPAASGMAAEAAEFDSMDSGNLASPLPSIT